MEHGKLNFVERDDSIFAGAIFMSNRETKLECLQRKLFGLPLSKSKFLKQVKAGMMLFLFEHEERKLYGVFEATSDGALNIIPDAFRSTGQSYPAQILFKRIWMCKPLCEDEFCSAIEENYYSPNKFHFGLSYKQVIKLVHLFYSRKINIKQYKGLGIPNKIIEKFENTAAEEVSLTETETYFKCRSDEYGSKGKREVRRQLALPQVSLDPPMLCKRPASTTSMLHTVNLSPLSYPHNSYSENLNSQRCSVCLSHDHNSRFHHFSIGKQPSTTSGIEYEPLPLRSIGKQPSTTSEIEYEPLPLRSIGKQPSTTSDIEYEPLPLRSCYMPNLDNMMAPNLISLNRHSSPDNVACELRCNDPAMIPRMAMIQKDAFTSSPVMNNSRPQTEIVQHSCASGAQPNQVFEFSEYIPLVEESRHKLDNRENQNSSLQNSEYIPSTRLFNSYIPSTSKETSKYVPSTSKETSKYFYSADGYYDDNEQNTYRRVEADEYNAVGTTPYADSDLSRNSVFSRLSRHQNICNDETPEPSCGEPSGGSSLDHFLNILSTRRNLWSAMEPSKQSMEWNRHEQFGCTALTARFHHRSAHRNKITRLPVQPVERGEIDQHDDNGITDAEHVGFPASLDSDLSNDVLDEESFEIPFYNFRRRNTSQKYEVQDYSNKYSDTCGSEAKLMESKRRRIVRPSLYDNCIKSVKAEAEVKTFAQSKEITEVETSAQVILESKNESKVSVVDSFLDGVFPGLQTVRKCEPVGESLEQNHVTSMDESLDYIPID